MSSTRIVWRVAPAPTGSYRSFQRRGWPTAYYGKGGVPLAFISCADDYYPANVRAGTHAPLTITVCHHQHPQRGSSWKQFRLKLPATTLDMAKAMVAEFFERHPDWLPHE